MFNTITCRRSFGALLAASTATLWVSAAAAQSAPAQTQEIYTREVYTETQAHRGAYAAPQGQEMPWNESAQGQPAPVYGQGYSSETYQGQGYEAQQGYQPAYPDQIYQQGTGVVPQTMPERQIIRQEQTHTRIERYVPPVDSTREGMGEALTPLPEERAIEQVAVNNPSNIRYMSGGIGQEEREQFKAAEMEFPVKLSFANRNGAFVSNVDVTITDSAGQTVLGLRTQGPILLVDLKPGEYVVEARDNGEVISRDINVSSSPRSYTVHFKAGAQDYSS